MNEVLNQRPRLRPTEAVPLDDDRRGQFALRDPSGLAEAVVTVTEPALFILSLFDGQHELHGVLEKFEARYGQRLGESTLVNLVENLRSARMLEGPAFEAHVAALVAEYRAAPVRKSLVGRQLGSGKELQASLARMLPLVEGLPATNGKVVGLVAPHLDYARGGPCYAEAYGALRGRAHPDRCVILGTNHFGRSTSVVATAKAFETPLGVTDVDTSFLETVEQRCGFDLREGEFDHQREHSVELQVICLQHLFGAQSFKIVPFLCPDLCGPTGTKPSDGRGVDLRVFAHALAGAMKADGADTLLVGGADLSHVGTQFGDSFRLDEPFLRFLDEHDRRALAHLESSRPDDFVGALAREGNATRVCSAGCMFVVASVLQDARPTLLRYYQAVSQDAQICVSCTAMTYAR